MECPNCQARVSSDWAHCTKCGADLKRRKYSQEDDPIERLNKKFDDINEFLTEKFPEENENAEDEENVDEPQPRRKRVAAKKRKTLFGD